MSKPRTLPPGSRPDATAQHVAANLKRLRELLKMSQVELAALAGTSSNNVTNYEQGKRLGRPDILASLAGALGVTIDVLLRAPGDDQPDYRIMPAFGLVVHPCARVDPALVDDVLAYIERKNLEHKTRVAEPQKPRLRPPTERPRH